MKKMIATIQEKNMKAINETGNNALGLVAKASVLAIAMVTMTGCVSMQTDMVDVNGNTQVCQASGGGIGLGAVVGVASAAAIRAICVSDWEDKGFVDKDDAGSLKLDIKEADGKLVIASVHTESTVEQAGVQAEDILAEINGSQPKTREDARRLMFGEIGDEVNLKLYRRLEEINVTAERESIY